LKPTYGRISRYGLVAYASSLDTVGIMARTAEDVALALSVLAGPDARDATSVAERAPDYRTACADAAAPVLGIVPATLTEGASAEVAQCVQTAIDQLRELGMRTRETALPHLHFALPAYYLIATAEASANLARYDGVRYGLRRQGSGRLEAMMAHSRSAGFGAEVQLRILLGTFALRAGWQDELYGKASRVRTLLRADFAAAFGQCDLLVMPTSPVPAFPIGSKVDDPAAMYACDLLTVPASLAGLPAISLPCGHTQAGLPIGLQLIAPPLREDLLLAVAGRFQQASAHHLRRPHLEAAV
jgi:aspartyl-tRNA(Asn)/glutamyl-tRNA(Gln) amidotransferase subunit A